MSHTRKPSKATDEEIKLFHKNTKATISKTGLSNIVQDQKILGKFTKPISNQAGFVSKELLKDVARKIGSVGRKGTGVASGGLTEALFYFLDKNNMISKIINVSSIDIILLTWKFLSTYYLYR